MRTLAVTKFLPLPADSGGKQRSLATLERLRGLGPVTLCAYDDGRADQDALARLGVDVRTAPRPSRREVPAGLWRTRSLTASRFWSRTLAGHVSATLADPVDVLYVNYAQLAPYARLAGARQRVLDLHNVESSLMTSYAASHRGVRRATATAEAAALRRIERWATSFFDVIVVVSEADRARLPAGRAAVLVCPNGCDPAPPLPPAPGTTAVFVALLGWAPNADAARWLAGDIWPRVRGHLPDARLLLVGRDAPRDLARLGGAGVQLVGEVPDVEPHLAASRVALAPLRSGGGSRLKILEALSRGRPVVATSVGAEGLDDLIGSGIVVADDPAALAASIAALLGDPERAERLGRAGQEAVVARYAWDVTLAPLVDALRAQAAPDPGPSSHG